MKMIKKIITFMLIAVFIFIAGCGQTLPIIGTETSEGEPTATANSSTPSDLILPTPVVEEETAVHKYKVNCIGAELIVNAYNEDTIVIKYKFTNKDDIPATFIDNIIETVYQGATQLSLTTIGIDKIYDVMSLNRNLAIDPGESIEVWSPMKLTNTTDLVEIEIREDFETLNDTLLAVITLDPKDL